MSAGAAERAPPGSVTSLHVKQACTRWLRACSLASFLLAGACSHAGPNACSGLVYTDSGVDRQQYLPCARAMVDELDRYYQELRTMGDTSLPMPERKAAHARCLASNARLMSLIRQAGGSEKLARVPWNDVTLSRINQNIMTARDVYLMYCYYGPIDRPFEVGQEEPAHADARREVEELR